MPKLLTRLKINEVSSVNRGAGEGVKILLMKRLDPDADPGTLGASAKTEKSATTAIAEIMDKALALGADADKVRHAAKTLGIVAGNIAKLDESEQLPKLEKSLSQCVEYLKGLVPEEKRDDFMAAAAAIPVAKGDDMPLSAEDQKRFETLEKSNKDLADTVSRLTLEATIGKLDDRRKAYVETLKKSDGAQDVEAVGAFLKKDSKAQVDDMDDADEKAGKKKKVVDKSITDAIEGSPIVKELRSTVTTLQKALEGVNSGTSQVAFAKKATDLGLKAEDGETIRKAYGGDVKAQEDLEKLMKGLTEQARTGALFKEFGNSDPRTHGSAYSEIVAKAEELRKTDAGKALSKYQAVAKVMTDPANVELVARNKRETLQKSAA